MTEVVWAKEDEWEEILEFNIAMAWETERKSLSAEVVELGVKSVFHNSGHGRYVVARIDGELVGQAMITFEWSDWRNGQIWWLQSVYVRPEYRRRGVFREIYRTVERYAR